MQSEALEIIKSKKALVIAGGGVLGIGEMGALNRLFKLGALQNIESVSGSSVGSIISTAIACKASLEYMEDMMFGLDLDKFYDKDCIFHDAYQLLKHWGLNKTKEIDRVAGKILSDLVGDKDITFGELWLKTGIHLTITYLSLGYRRTMYADYKNEPHSLVREAIVKSSSIPLFYEVYTSEKGKKKMASCDGGTLNNYPMNIPREQGYKPEEIIGLKLVPEDQIHSIDNGGPGLNKKYNELPKNVLEYLILLTEMLRNQALKVHVHKYDWKQTVKINVGKLSSTDFSITEEQKKQLFENGQKAVDAYIEEVKTLLIENQYP